MLAMANLENLQIMFRSMEKQVRNNMISEIQAFANDYHHHIDGRDVVIVEQLLDFLRDVDDSERP
jgi:cytidylate kinase